MQGIDCSNGDLVIVAQDYIVVWEFTTENTCSHQQHVLKQHYPGNVLHGVIPVVECPCSGPSSSLGGKLPSHFHVQSVVWGDSNCLLSYVYF